MSAGRSCWRACPSRHLLDALTLGQLFVVALLAGAGCSSRPRTRRSSSPSSLARATSTRTEAQRVALGVVRRRACRRRRPRAALQRPRRRPGRRGDVPLLRVPDRPRRRRGAPTRHGGELAPEPRPRGLGLVVRHPVLRAGLGCATTINFFTFMVSPGDPVREPHARPVGRRHRPRVRHRALAVGAVLAPRLAARFGVGRVIVAGAILFPAPLALLALAGGRRGRPPRSSPSSSSSPLGVMCFDVNLNSLQTSVIPDEVRSRVAGAFSTINYGVRPLGAVAGGLLGTYVGVRETLVLGAIGDVVDPLAAALADSRLCARSRSSRLRSAGATPRSGPRLACSRASARQA